MDDRSFFDRIAPEWDASETLSLPDKINEILNFFDLKPGHHVLDLGTGTGVLIPYINQRIGSDGKITAVDFSEGMLQRAKEKYKDLEPKPEFLNLDFENETIPGEFDRIILYCVYPHLHEPINTLKWLQKVNLKEKGEIFIAFPCNADFINNIHKERHSESGALLSCTELAGFLREQGLDATSLIDEDRAYVIKISNSK